MNMTLKGYEEAIGMRERLPAVDFPVRAYLQERAKRLRAIQERWQECGEKECAAVYQGAAFELELLLQHSIAAAAPPMVSERALTTDLARTATDKELITLLLLRQSSLCKITESHDDYATILEAKKSAEREVLFRLASAVLLDWWEQHPRYHLGRAKAGDWMAFDKEHHTCYAPTIRECLLLMQKMHKDLEPIPTHATVERVCEVHPEIGLREWARKFEQLEADKRELGRRVQELTDVRRTLAEKNETANVFMNQVKKLQEKEHGLEKHIKALEKAVGFFASTIKSGEPWSVHCDAALAEIYSAREWK